VIHFLIIILAFAMPAALRAQVTAKTFGGSFDSWAAAGETTLFAPAEGGIRVDWNSSKTNSYLYLPLGFALTRKDDFDVTFVMRIDALQLGTTPGKEDTFEIAAGLLNLTNALRPDFFRGAGINPEHGPRNLFEFDYFPASGFITATVAPTIATAGNQILFSDNHPMELDLGVYYKVQMSFTAQDQTLRSKLWQSGTRTNFAAAATELKPLILSVNYGDFAVDTLALINYNDEGQVPPQFSGSLQGSGTFWNMETTVYNRPEMHIRKVEGEFVISFETSIGWRYELQAQTSADGWEVVSQPIDGTGHPIELQIAPGNSQRRLFRIGGTRL
jgi:hypothetical protein